MSNLELQTILVIVTPAPYTKTFWKADREIIVKSLGIFTAPIIINAKVFENIFKANKVFEVICFFIMEGIKASDKIPVQFPETWYFIRKESIEVMFNMCKHIKFWNITKLIDGQKLKAIKIFAGNMRDVAIEMLVIGDLG